MSLFVTRLDSPFKWPITSDFPGQATVEATYTVTLPDSTAHTAYVRYVGTAPSQQEVQDRCSPPDTIENRLANMGQLQAALILRASSGFANLSANQKTRIMAIIDNAAQGIITAITGAS